MLHASTGGDALKRKADALVDGLACCQAADGYLGAYPTEFYDRLAAGIEVWVPIYTVHKIIAGHLDMARYCGNAQALCTATRLACVAAG